MGIFIQIQVEAERLKPETAQQLVALCPVEIFALAEQQLYVRPEQEDECTLCELCLEAAPAGTLVIRKSYKAELLISRGKTGNG